MLVKSRGDVSNLLSRLPTVNVKFVPGLKLVPKTAKTDVTYCPIESLCKVMF
jgi:hypothetical protein